MKRSKPLRRKTPLRRKGKGKYARRPRDRAHMMRVKKLPCAVRWLLSSGWDVLTADGLGSLLTIAITPCYGRVEADHKNSGVKGHKSPDDETFPMCRNHHGERTDHRGAFKDVPKDKMRMFCDWAIARTRRELEEMNRGK